jgi:uncharacterized protein YkwD
MGPLRKASTLVCATVLACGTCAAAAPPGALAGTGNASASDYQSSSKHAPTRSRPRPTHRFAARCPRRAGHRARARIRHGVRRTARGKAAKRRPSRARTHARGTRCGEHLLHRRHRRARLGHGRSGHRRTHRGTHRARHHALRRHTRRQRAARSPSAGRSSACANASITPTATNVELVRAAILCLINSERQDAGERPLMPVASLSEAAQRHTEDMAFGDYFEHVGPRGDTPAQRMRAAGYLDGAQSFEVGENIAFGTGWMASPRAIVAGWMASPGHRANILDSNYRDTGIGASAHPPASFSGGQRGAIYTEDFGVVSG